MEQTNTYAFGSFKLDTATQFLCNEQTNITLTPKVYRLLLFFLLHPGRLISHQELFDKVWDGRIVDDSALRLAVNSLRKALQDDSKTSYISTICKKGYRFMAEVSVSACHQTVKTRENNPLQYRPKTVAFPVRHEHTQYLAELVQALQQTASGKRHLVFLHGEQSIGKTAMLDTFLAEIHHPELSVLRTRCVKMEGSTEPFLPVLEALERRCRESQGRLLFEHLNYLAPSWLHQMLNVLSPEELAALPPKEVQVNTCLMLREAADFFETLSCNTTLILT